MTIAIANFTALCQVFTLTRNLSIKNIYHEHIVSIYREMKVYIDVFTYICIYKYRRYWIKWTHNTWWCHGMETLSASLAFYEGNPPVIAGFCSQTEESFGVFFVVSLTKLLIKQSSSKTPCRPCALPVSVLNHWGRDIYLSQLIIMDSDDGLSPARCQAIIWTNVGI